jgi:ankyrin repeat protein
MAARSHSKVHICDEPSTSGKTACTMFYPMYALPIADLQQLTRFPPHQELLKAGKLVEIKDGMDVLFVSHQWLSMQHPDPESNQLKCLQRVLSRLADGELDVENNWQQQIVLHDRGLKSKKWWKAKMTMMYVWVDYMCMPQLTSVKKEEVISHSDTHQSSEQPSMRCQDHSKYDSDDSKLLSFAVKSLPAYVERCCMMMVLVPTDEHRDRTEEVVDWCSWRRRGWCRLEFTAARLCRHPVPVMVVKDDFPEFILATDALFISPGLGEFSCCAMKHDFGNGKIPCDKIAVGNVMSLLMEAKVEHLKRAGRWFEMRYFASLQVRVDFTGILFFLWLDLPLQLRISTLPKHTHIKRLFQHYFFRGLEQEESGGKRRSSVNLGQKHANQEFKNDASRLQALKERLEWQDEGTESKRTRSSGTSLLSWAVLADDLSSVREILRSEMKDIDRGLTQSHPKLSIFAKMTPLMMAMGFARWGVVEALLNAGANPLSTNKDGHDALMVAAIYGKDGNNIRGWLKRYPQWSLERQEATIGATALLWAAGTGANKVKVVEALLEHGANPLVLSHTGASVVTSVALNPDSSPDLMQWLLHYTDGKLLPMLKLGCSPRAMQWRIIYSITQVLARVGVRRKVVQEIASWEGQTPLHFAGAMGHLAICDVLVRNGAPLDARTAQGLTPLQLTENKHGGTIPETFSRISGMSGRRGT